MRRNSLRTAAYWTTTIFGPTSFVIGGVLALTQSDEVLASTAHLGFPAYFTLILGTWKLLGAIAVTAPGLPRVKEWAYAGFFFDLTAAAVAHAVVGDGAADIISPLVFLALVIASYLLRPPTRKLAVQPAAAVTPSYQPATSQRAATALA